MTTIPWPANVRGMDWTQPAMAGPPRERIRIGYHRWAHTLCDTEHDDFGYPCGVDYYVCPDGSAEIVRWGLSIRDGYREDSWHVDGDTATEVLAPGTWEVVYPTSTFGSRGGCWISRIAPPVSVRRTRSY